MNAKHFGHFLSLWRQWAEFQRADRPAGHPGVGEAKAKLRAVRRPAARPA